MASQNQLRVNLGSPIPKLNAHECLYVHQGTDRNALTVSFKRTIRVPDDGTTYQLPPNLGNFPLYNVAHYKETLPESMMLKGGCFMPVHEREALWIRFKSTGPFAIKVLLGGINAISGEPIIETFATALRRARLINEKKSIQDYAVIDPADKGQLWLDGIAKLNGKVRQFVAVPFGSGYSVEAQIANADAVGGIQIIVTPIKRTPLVALQVKCLGRNPIHIAIRTSDTVFNLMTTIADKLSVPIAQFGLLFNNRRLEQNRLLSCYGITQGSVINLVLNLQGGGALNVYNNPGDSEMSIGAGGLIKQSILGDPHPATAWDSENTALFNIQLLSATVFEHVTGMVPPPSPVTAESYAAAGLPFYSIPSEVDSGVQGMFSDIKSVGQMDREKGKKGLDRELKFPTIELDETGKKVGFRGVEQLVGEVTGWGIAQTF